MQAGVLLGEMTANCQLFSLKTSALVGRSATNITCAAPLKKGGGHESIISWAHTHLCIATR
jgi:hypothetical protein